MKKVLRTAFLIGTIALTATPAFCSAPSGGNPRPPSSAWSIFVGVIYSVLGI
jgi:hypothetical protein